MISKDLKYFLAFIPSIGAFWGLHMGGTWTYTALIIAFGIVPILEFILRGSADNFTLEEEGKRMNLRYFDFLLYSNVAILYGLIALYFHQLNTANWSSYEIIGATASLAVINGTVGINVAHELGHRSGAFEKFLSLSLLLPNLYMHFNIEHVLGHHKNVATRIDPATSRKGEILYAFWFRSITGCYLGAWELENKRLNREGLPTFSLKNKMIRYQLIQILYLVIIGSIYGWLMIPFAIAIAVGGFILLETVNYIEHYGLQRKKLASGRYETVKPHHSWNSNHQVGRILLYELTRHADHHYKANRPYQILKHIEYSPQLPLGYPGSMIVSFIPPLWFRIMNKRLEQFEELDSK